MKKTKIALMTIPGLAAVLIVGSFAPALAGCPGCIFGTSGNDKISGGDGEQFIFGLGGDDKIQAGDGDDFVDPGTGADRVTLGDGDDDIGLQPDGEVDRILCGDGNDRVFYFPIIDPLDIFKDCEQFLED